MYIYIYVFETTYNISSDIYIYMRAKPLSRCRLNLLKTGRVYIYMNMMYIYTYTCRVIYSNLLIYSDIYTYIYRSDMYVYIFTCKNVHGRYGRLAINDAL